MSRAVNAHISLTWTGRFDMIDSETMERWEPEMLLYLVSAVIGIAIGAYGMLVVIGLCAASASAERREALLFDNQNDAACNLGAYSPRETSLPMPVESKH